MIRPLTVMSLPAIVKPLGSGPASTPSSSIKGVLEYPGCIVPSMVTGAVIAGKAESTSIVCWPVPRAKAIVVAPPRALAYAIASRNEPTPESAVLDTV